MEFSKRKKFWLNVLGFAIGFLIGGFTLFQILFLSKVIPHGGI